MSSLAAFYSIVDRLGNRAHYAATISLETRRVTAYVVNGVPAMPRYLECDKWQAETLEQIAIFSDVMLPERVLDLDAADFDPEYVGKGTGRELHVELARAGHGQGYAFCSRLLERSVLSLAQLTLEETCAVRDALRADENLYLETCHIPEVALTNPVHGSFRISLDPNQSGVFARARKYLQ